MIRSIRVLAGAWNTRSALEGRAIGYGSVAKAGPWKAAPVIYEFFVQRPFRSRLFDCFVALHQATGVSRIETQSNDVWLTSMLHTFARDVKAESILFKDEINTDLSLPDVHFRNPTLGELPDVEPNQLASHGVLVLDGKVAAKGGILFHYNRTVWGHLHGGQRAFSQTWSGRFSGPGTETALLPTGKCPLSALQSGKHRLAQNTSEGRVRAVRPHPGWRPCRLMVSILGAWLRDLRPHGLRFGA